MTTTIRMGNKQNTIITLDERDIKLLIESIAYMIDRHPLTQEELDRLLALRTFLEESLG